MLRFRSAALAALPLLLASTAWADLRTYDVDPQYQQEIYTALRRVLDSGPPTNGKVELLPSGQILVNASAETLEQVEKVMQALRSRPAPPAPRVELQYWAVLGTRPSAANAAAQRGPNVSLVGSRSPADLPAPPDALNEVLAELIRVHGNLQFRVLGTTSLTTQSGQRGEIGGAPLRVEQTTFVQGDTLNARIEMVLTSTTPEAPSPSTNKVEVGTSLRRGEFIVLGQSELVGGGLDGPVFFIVHWPGPQGR